MKALVAVHRDGSRHLLLIAPLDFDSQSWVQSRLDAARILDIIKVEEVESV